MQALKLWIKIQVGNKSINFSTLPSPGRRVATVASVNLILTITFRYFSFVSAH